MTGQNRGCRWWPHMVKMADVEETTSDAADLLHSHDVEKEWTKDNADVGNDHHVVSIHLSVKFLKCGTK